jgi:hypothetical protein
VDRTRRAGGIGATEMNSSGRAERQTLVLVRAGLPAHRSQPRQACVRRWGQEERLPGRAPERDPPEQAWEHTKGQELANLWAESLAVAGA